MIYLIHDKSLNSVTLTTLVVGCDHLLFSLSDAPVCGSLYCCICVFVCVSVSVCMCVYDYMNTCTCHASTIISLPYCICYYCIDM